MCRPLKVFNFNNLVAINIVCLRFGYAYEKSYESILVFDQCAIRFIFMAKEYGIHFNQLLTFKLDYDLCRIRNYK